MDNPAVVAAWAAAIAAVIGPIISVAIASGFARHESMRTEASVVFRRIMENVQNYRHAFLNQHRFRSQIEKSQETLNQLLDTIKVTAEAMDAQGESLHAQARALYDHGTADLREIEGRFAQAFNETRSLESLLNADKLSLGLLFDKHSEKCGQAINELIKMSELFNRAEIPKMDVCQDELNNRIQAITTEFKPLYESVRRSDPIRTDCGC